MSKLYRLLASAGIGYLVGLGFGRPGFGLIVGFTFGVFSPVLRYLFNPLAALLLVLLFVVVVPHPLIVLIGLTLLIPLVFTWGLFSPQSTGEEDQKWFDFFDQSDPNRLMVRLMAGLIEQGDPSTDQKIRSARSFILRNNQGIRGQFLWKTFQKTLDTTIDTEQVAQEISNKTSHRQRIFCLRVLANIAATDGKPTDQEEQYLHTVAENMGMDTSRVQSILNEAQSEQEHRQKSRKWTDWQSNRRRRRKRRSRRNGPSLRDAYRTLDLTPSASRKEVKEAYQEKVKQYHPDRHRNDGEEAMEEAEEKMAEINQAYQTIQDHWDNAQSR